MGKGEYNRRVNGEESIPCRSLIMVCHPFTSHSRIICFDSQLASDPNDLRSAAQLIADFFKVKELIADFFKVKENETMEDTVVLIDNLFSFQYTHTSRGGASICPSMETSLVVPFVPSNLQQQENHYDCGLYVLEYARRFLLNPPKKVLYLIYMKYRR